MNEVEFVLPIKINSKLSLNSIYKLGHWSRRKKQSEEIHKFVKMSLLSQRVPKIIFENPIDISFSWNSKLDLDNHGYLAKLIIDGLKGYLIKDDTQKYIHSIYHQYGAEKGVKVSIKELVANAS